MERFNVVTNTMLGCLASLADWLYGCSHRRTTFPITLRAGVKEQGRKAETYVVCLECGRHFAYDWTAMRMIRQRSAWGVPAADGLSTIQ